MLSKLTAEQKHSLQSMTILLGLAADLAQASVTVYLPTEDKKYLNVYKQEHPQTQVGEARPDLTGRRLRAVEEPLVMRCLQKNMMVSGKREWSLGSFNSLHVFPIADGRGRIYAALSFEKNGEHDDVIIAQCLELLKNATSSVQGNENYRRMQPFDGIMVVAPDRRIIAANHRAHYIFEVMGITELLGLRITGVNINWPLVSMVMDTGIAESKEFMMNGLLLSIRIIPVVPIPKGGCGLVIVQDVTELRKKDEELLLQSVVIKEIHHRVKNNLQTIASLLRLQARRATNDETRSILHDCLGRVNSIAIVHEYLSQQDSDLIELDKVAKGIYQAVLSSMQSPDLRLETTFKADAVQLPSHQATSVALILNELLQNALEHAFEGRNTGKLAIEFTDEPEEYRLQIVDDGIGLPADFKIDGHKSLGLKIIKTMAEADLHGKFTLINGEHGGTIATVVLPKS